MPAPSPTATRTTSSSGRPPRTGPVRRVVAGSLLTGAVLAAVLPVLVFAGAREAVITGSALLGFAVGWAVLAVLSVRLKGHPHRWAWVPAAALGGTGLGLLVLAPDDRVLTAAGWAWPPLLLALAVWSFRRVRRSPAAGRLLLSAVVAVMAAAAVGGAVETVGLAADQRASAIPGRLHDVGGYRLHLDCTGSGSPTVVLQNGLGEISANWARVAPVVAGSTRVCAYDRAGQAWSEDAPARQDGLQAAADLHTLLERAGEHGPFVLVGHSIGGDHALTYAARYPEQVAGMVLLDTTDPYRSDGASLQAGPPSSMAVLPSVARLGVGRLLSTSWWSGLPEPAASRFRAFAASPRGLGSTADEAATLPALLFQAQALRTLGSAPLVVVTAAVGHEGDRAWATAQDRMAALSAQSSHRSADTSHAGLLETVRGAEESARAVTDVVRAVRTGTPLPAR